MKEEWFVNEDGQPENKCGFQLALIGPSGGGVISISPDDSVKIVSGLNVDLLRERNELAAHKREWKEELIHHLMSEECEDEYREGMALTLGDINEFNP